MSSQFTRALLFLIFSALLYALLIYPWYVEARAKYDQIQYLNTVLLQIEAVNQKRDSLLSEFNSIEWNKVALINNAIPPHSETNVILFHLALKTFIAQSGLPSDTRYGIGSEQKDAETEMVTIPIRFSLDPIDYNVLMNFISNLQRWERMVRIESVQIYAASDDQRPNAVRALIQTQALFSSPISNEET